MRRGDGRERQAAARPASRLLQHRSGDSRFMDARAGHPVGDQVHPRGNVHRLFDGGDFLRSLVVPHVHDGLDEGLVGPLLPGGDPQQLLQPHFMVTAVRRQEPDLPARQIALERAQGHGFLHAAQLRVVLQRRNGPGPDDIVDREFVAKDYFLAPVDVDDRGQPGLVQAEIVQERAVLPERILVVMVVHAHELVPQEQQDAVAHLLHEAGAAVDVCFLVKHITGFCCFPWCTRSRTCAWRSAGRWRGNSGPGLRTGPDPVLSVPRGCSRNCAFRRDGPFPRSR